MAHCRLPETYALFIVIYSLSGFHRVEFVHVVLPSLRAYPKRIETYKEALSIDNIGERTAAKVGICSAALLPGALNLLVFDIDNGDHTDRGPTASALREYEGRRCDKSILWNIWSRSVK